jgi:hypothetical protein
MAEEYGALGEKNEVMDWLEKADEERDDWINSIKVDPNLDVLRSEPRAGFSGDLLHWQSLSIAVARPLAPHRSADFFGTFLSAFAFIAT